MAHEVLIKKALEKYLIELGVLQSEYPSELSEMTILTSSVAKSASDSWNEKLLEIGDALLVPMENTPSSLVYKELFKKVAIAARTKGVKEMNKAMDLLRNQMKGDIVDLKEKTKKEVGTVGKILIAGGILYVGYKALQYGMKKEDAHKRGSPGGNHAPRVQI